MNMSKTVQDYSASEEKEKNILLRRTNQEKLNHALSVLETIRALKSYDKFNKFKRLIIEPELASLNSRLRRQSETIEVSRIQGSLTSLEKWFNLGELEKFWQNLAERYKERSRQLTNPNKE